MPTPKTPSTPPPVLRLEGTEQPPSGQFGPRSGMTEHAATDGPPTPSIARAPWSDVANLPWSVVEHEPYDG